jgi:hypothetical protein
MAFWTETKTMSVPEINGQCEGLDAPDVERVTTFMSGVIQAFESCDPFALEKLSHVGGDPRGRKNTFEYRKLLMEGGDKVRAWVARPYSEPKWGIMRSLRHHPNPAIWIEVTLNDGQRDNRVCYACSLNEQGALRICYYVDR